MKKLVLLLCMCLCMCSNNKNRYIGKYDNVSYYVNEQGSVIVDWFESKYDQETMTFIIIQEKHWDIANDTISFIWERTKNTHLTNTFFEYKYFYRLVVYQQV